MDRPSVSVVIPTFNCAALLPEAIRSAYGQSFTPAEVIVVDDGCTDDTAAVVERLTRSLPERLVYVRKPNGGEASARNRGVSVAKGDYIAFLDQDDVWLPEKLEHQMQLFEADPSIALTFSAYTRVSGGTRELVRLTGWEQSPEHALEHLMEGCCITPSTVVVRRDVLNAVGPFDESLWLGNDWDMWIRMAAAGHRFAYLMEPMTDYLWHATNMSSDKRKIAEAALTIFPRAFGSGTLPTSLQHLERRCMARWHLVSACYRLEAGQHREVRRSLRAAIRARPGSARPGWALMYLKSLFGGTARSG